MSRRDALITYLIRGFGFVEQFTEHELRDGWSEVGERLTALHADSHPCTRPWAWWRYDAPERRHCTSGHHPHDDPVFQSLADNSTAMDLRELRYGIPRYMRGEMFNATFESEHEYLDRLNLLFPNERITLSGGAHKGKRRRA